MSVSYPGQSLKCVKVTTLGPRTLHFIWIYRTYTDYPKKRRGYCNRLPSVRLSVMLSPPKSLDEIQPNLVCELLTWACSVKLFGPIPLGPWGRGQKSKNHLISITKLFSYIFYTKLCVCSRKLKIQSISDGIFILSPGSCHRGGTLGRWGAQGVKNSFFFKLGHVTYQSDGDDEQNRMQSKNFHPRVKLVTLG